MYSMSHKLNMNLNFLLLMLCFKLWRGRITAPHMSWAEMTLDTIPSAQLYNPLNNPSRKEMPHCLRCCGLTSNLQLDRSNLTPSSPSCSSPETWLLVAALPGELENRSSYRQWAIRCKINIFMETMSWSCLHVPPVSKPSPRWSQLYWTHFVRHNINKLDVSVYEIKNNRDEMASKLKA